MHRRNLHSSLSYLLKAGAVGALADLVNERPFEQQTSERLHRVYSSLTQPFPVLRFLFAAVKDKRFISDGAGVSSVVEWLLLRCLGTFLKDAV